MATVKPETIEKTIQQRQDDLRLLEEQRAELSLQLLNDPTDTDTDASLEKTEQRIAEYKRKVTRLQDALREAKKNESAEAVEAERQACMAAANEALQLAKKRTKLAAKLDSTTREFAELINGYLDLTKEIGRKARRAGLKGDVYGHLSSFDGMDYAISAILHEYKVSDRLTFPFPSSAFPRHTCEETAERTGNKLRAHLGRLEYPGDE